MLPCAHTSTLVHAHTRLVFRMLYRIIVINLGLILTFRMLYRISVINLGLLSVKMCSVMEQDARLKKLYKRTFFTVLWTRHEPSILWYQVHRQCIIKLEAMSENLLLEVKSNWGPVGRQVCLPIYVVQFKLIQLRNKLPDSPHWKKYGQWGKTMWFVVGNHTRPWGIKQT